MENLLSVTRPLILQDVRPNIVGISGASAGVNQHLPSRNDAHASVLDWGLLELARREGWDKAESRLREITHLNTYDFRLYLGNFRLHPRTFGIIGLWYPKIPVQQSLF